MNAIQHPPQQPGQFDSSGQPAPGASASRLWLWLAIPPLAAVVGGIFTVYLALTHPDPIIKVPVERLGKAPVVDNRAAIQAQSLGLSALLTRSPEGQLRLRLNGASHPETLELLWIDPTRAELDRGAVLLVERSTEEAGERITWYHGVLPEPASSHGQWLLRDSEQSWRLDAQAGQSSGEFELRPVLR